MKNRNNNNNNKTETKELESKIQEVTQKLDNLELYLLSNRDRYHSRLIFFILFHLILKLKFCSYEVMFNRLMVQVNSLDTST